MLEKSEYIFGYPNGETPMNAFHRRGYEAFDLFMKQALSEEFYKKWIAAKQIRMAVCQVVDTLL